MYQVSFKNVAKELPSKSDLSLVTADLDRALALASLFDKISTPEFQFGDIKVQPLNLQNNEKEK